jgi:DNA-binding response OmpR family regulator
MDYGADEFAVKPLSMESLINKVNMKLLEEAAKSSSSSSSKEKSHP